LLDEGLAVAVIHLAEQLLAKLVIPLDGLPLVDFFDDLFLLVDVFLYLGPVLLEGGVSCDHVESFEPTLANLVLFVNVAAYLAQSFVERVFVAGLFVGKLCLQLF